MEFRFRCLGHLWTTVSVPPSVFSGNQRFEHLLSATNVQNLQSLETGIQWCENLMFKFHKLMLGDCNCTNVPGCKAKQVWGKGLERENGSAQALVSEYSGWYIVVLLIPFLGGISMSEILKLKFSKIFAIRCHCCAIIDVARTLSSSRYWTSTHNQLPRLD